MAEWIARDAALSVVDFWADSKEQNDHLTTAIRSLPGLNPGGWIRIPAAIDSEADRRQLAAILAAAGLEVRIVKEKKTPNGSYKKYVEFREATK